MSIIDSIKPLFCESKFFLPPNTNNHTRADAKKMMKRKGGLKVGQGGTLDPLADGVLVLGIGKGTKHLGQFLHCTKVCQAEVGHERIVAKKTPSCSHTPRSDCWARVQHRSIRRERSSRPHRTLM